MRLALFDMDKTLTDRASWTPWLFHYARTEAPWRLALAPLLLAPVLGFGLGLLDRRGLKQATQRLMLGPRTEGARVRRAAAAFAARFGARHERPEALAAIAAARAAGFEPGIATASPRYYVEALAARWGIERVIATENRWEGDRLIPAIRGENCYGPAKLRMVLAALGARPERVRFATDHESDLAVLLWADEPLCVSPSSELRRAAAARGWPVVDWA
jgi:HAD superfamily phosphoserine phosphatase-like hydrolase